MKTRVIIPYFENKDKHILIALSSMKDYGGLAFEDIGDLRDKFHEKNDIHYDVPSEKIPELLKFLTSDGFVYKTLEN